MIEKTMHTFLASKLAVPVYGEEQENSTVPYVVLDKTGGSVRDCIESGSIAVQTYGSTKLEAAELAETVKTALTDCSVFSSCKVNAGPYNYTDTAKRKYRYQTVYEIVE